MTSIQPADFWYGVAGGESLGPSSETVAAMAAGSDLIIEGTVVGIRAGRDIAVAETKETQYQATLLVRVDQAVRGAAVSPAGQDGLVQVEFLISFNPGAYGAWETSAPIGDRVLLFLVNKGAEAARLGLASDAPGWGKEFYAVRNTQGYVRNVDGLAEVRPEPGPDWLARWSGRTFQDVVTEVRTAAD